MPDSSPPADNPYQSPIYSESGHDVSALPSRKGLIQLMGTAAILAGVAFGCLGGFYCFFIPGFLPQPPNGPDLMKPVMLSTGLLMAVFAAGLLWLGVGTVRLRRWAGALYLAAGWLFATMAFGYLILMAILMPNLMQSVSASLPENAKGSTPPGLPEISMLIGVGFVLFLYLVPPLIAILVFRLKSVKATLHRADPGPSWTDGMPLPVLIAWVWLAAAAASMLGMAPGYGPMYRFMGVVQHDWQAIAAMLALAGIAGLSAWGIVRRQEWSWFGALVLALIMVAVAVVTMLRVDFAEVYKQMGMTDAQLRQNVALQQNGSLYKGPAIVISAALLLFLLVTKRYYRFSEHSSAA